MLRQCLLVTFHKRQTNKNITYIGNAFPHNYADVGTMTVVCMILDWGKDPVYIHWPDAPKYRKFRLSQLLEDTDRLLLSNMYCRVEIDVDISYEEATFIKEQFIPQYNLRELSLIQRTDLEEHAQSFMESKL